MFSLVTGGAGFIGSHIVRALLGQGDQVRVLDNLSTGKREHLDGLNGALQLLETDLRDAASVDIAVKGVEVIFHEAAFVSVPQSVEDPQGCFDVNVTGTSLLLNAARKAGVRRVVIASSAAVYGDAEIWPQSETLSPKPHSPYALSKRIDEMYGQMFTTSYGLEVVALRYYNVYGSRQSPDSMYAAAIPIFLRRLLDGKPVTIFGDGGQSRDLIHVGDVVRANLIAASHPAAAGEIFNICTGIETRLLDLLEVLSDLFPSAPAPEFAPPRSGDIYRSLGDPHKAAEMIGFSSEVQLSDGLKEAADWMRRG